MNDNDEVDILRNGNDGRESEHGEAESIQTSDYDMPPEIPGSISDAAETGEQGPDISEKNAIPSADSDVKESGKIYITSASALEDKSAPSVWSKKHIAVIGIVCVISAVVGGILGGMTAYRLISGQNIPVSETTEVSAGTTTASVFEQTAASQPTTEVTYKETNETESDTTIRQTVETTSAPTTTAAPVTQAALSSSTPGLSASEIYSKYVNTVVGVASQVAVNTSFFGSRLGTSTGSGFLITADGYIVTNYHVIEGSLSTVVSLYGGEQYEAAVVGYEQSNDLAILKIDAKDLNFAVFGNSDKLAVGDSVLIIGNPLGDLTYSLTSGVVSALDRSINTGSRVVNMHQTDAAINRGNSGGPVFNMNGEVVGIASAKYTSNSAEGLSFFIPSSDILGYINDIITYGYVRGQASMGVSVQTLTLRTAQRYGLVPGVYIAAVGEGTAAANAGLAAGDVIVAVENTAVSSVEDIELLLSRKSSGNTFSVTFNRDGLNYEAQLRLDEKVPAAPRTDSPSVKDI